ncbi:unnamed protein product [Mytilus edulis]|uniref:Reverse transcriptase domain-containing protein n=1 Tax=Mytilus edulis TaxID=6550 RepID=A0A8S3RPK6_MYTED|nr:unnamed protein product [Mytilus edulis]
MNHFHVNTGVKQGCLLSPTLLVFFIDIDWVTKQALDTTPRDIQWNFVQRLEDLDFADDLALLYHRLKDMRDKTTKLRETGKKLGPKINIKKTKIMKVKTGKGGTVSIEGEDIEEVDQFTYLGSIMDRTGGIDADIRIRISKARKAFAMLKPVLKSTAFLSTNACAKFVNFGGQKQSATNAYGKEPTRNQQLNS